MLLWLCFRMRNRLSTAVKGGWSQKNMERAVEDVLKACLPVKSAAEKHQVSRTSLRRRLDAIRRGDSFENKAYSQSSMRVFSSEEELQLKEYLIHASKMGYGLSD